MSFTNLPKILRGILRLIKYLAIGLFSIYLLIWIFSPFAIRPLINNVLQEQDIQLSNDSIIRYNPFLTMVTIKNLRLIKDNITELELKSAKIEIDLHRLIFDTIYIKTLEISEANIPIVQTDSFLSIAGFEIPSKENEESPDLEPQQESESDIDYTVISPDIVLRDIDVTYTKEDIYHTVGIDALNIKSLKANKTAQNFAVDLDAKVDEGKVSLQTDVTLENKGGNVRTKVSIDDFELNAIAKDLQGTVEAISGEISLESKVDVEISENTFNIAVDNSTIDLDNINVKKDDFLFSLKNQTTTIDSIRTLIVDNKIESIDAQSGLQFGNFTAASADKMDTLLSWDALKISPISFNASDDFNPESLLLEVGNIVSSNMLASQIKNEERNIPALTTIKELNIEKLTYRNNDIQIQSIVIDSIVNQVLIGKNKEILTLAKISQQTESTTEQSEETLIDASDDNSEIKIKLGSFSITGENQVFFNDQSVTPNYERVFYVDTFTISDINNQDNALSPFELVGRSNEYAKVNLKGAVNPFSTNVNLKLAGDLQEVSLPSVSAYIKDSLGFELKSGQLDSNLDVSITESQLDGKVKLHLRGMDMSAADSSDTTSLKDQSAIPLNVALGMLKDKKGNIKLSIPMNGSVDDPSFGVSSFLVLVTKKAAMSQAKSYLMKTFVPYASVISVAMSAGEFALKLRFEDLAYQPTVTTIGDEQQKFVQEFVALMIDKPKTQVKVCGIATADEAGFPKGIEVTEQDALDTLNSIAKQRAENFKKHVVNEGGIESSRILLCNPKINFGKEAQPRIEISI